MNSILTHSYACANLHPNQCRGCGVFTSGWAPTYTGEVRYGIKVRGPNYTLCGRCGGTCCGDCRPGKCEFGFEGGGPFASSPENDE